jgi:hypothetical protein
MDLLDLPCLKVVFIGDCRTERVARLQRFASFCMKTSITSTSADTRHKDRSLFNAILNTSIRFIVTTSFGLYSSSTYSRYTRCRMSPASKDVVPTPQQDANLKGGISYWANQSASNDGVMGGYGHLSSVDALSSRMFLLTVMQRLSTISSKKGKGKSGSVGSGSSSSTTNGTSSESRKRTRALDVAAGIGRVSAHTLLPLIDEVHLVEPVEHYIKEAHRAASSGEWKSLKDARADGQAKACTFYEASLQEYDPSNPQASKSVGSVGEEEQDRPGYDVIWAQWGLGHCKPSYSIIPTSHLSVTLTECEIMTSPAMQCPMSSSWYS